ncbi:tyrosine-type recombinase/integrase [Actinoallomurus purpureus]|uniref:tyrosine-type recombinase/integrase n=1 Tax=Actinoallomurus purpureus TaxID=478114 RepID=UPI0020926BAB|nr:tyrosine-type recombinase/integrase [Actinoallomurus purpureus]MCO6011553.1 tyrosine-type recombinase/integrase [Actinoallomurus purpureus]
MTESRELQPIDGTLAPAGVPIDALRQLVTAWILATGRAKSKHTRRAYARDITQWFAWLDECGVGPFEAYQAHVDGWSESMLTIDLSPATIARKISCVGSFYRYAIRQGKNYGITATVNPAAEVERPYVDRDHSETAGLTADQARDMIRAADADRKRTAVIVRLMLEVGFRASDVDRARIEDLGEDRGHRTLTVTRKGGRRQRMALPVGVARAIDELIGDRTEGPIVTTRTGQPMAHSEVFRTVRRIGEKVGVKVTPHGLRHTCATLALDAGAPLRDVQDLLGHADPRTTRRYDRARENLDRSASYKVAAYLGV